MGVSPIAAAVARSAAAAASAVPAPPPHALPHDALSWRDATVLRALCSAVNDVVAMVATLRLPDVDPNIRAPASVGGFTALHVAASCGDADVILYLVAAGARLDARDAMGHTPLATAVLAGGPERVVALLRCGAATALLASEAPAALELALDMLAEDMCTQRVRVAGALLDHMTTGTPRHAPVGGDILHCAETL